MGILCSLDPFPLVDLGEIRELTAENEVGNDSCLGQKVLLSDPVEVFFLLFTGTLMNRLH